MMFLRIGRLKKHLFDEAYENWKINKNPKTLKNLLLITSIILKSLSHVHWIFEAIKELVELFKISPNNHPVPVSVSNSYISFDKM